MRLPGNAQEAAPGRLEYSLNWLVFLKTGVWSDDGFRLGVVSPLKDFPPEQLSLANPRPAFDSENNI